jgi:hypothetical protein
MIKKGMNGVTWDFSSAFHHLGMQEDLRRRCNFRYDGVTYRYVGLPFGLRSAPRLFCKAMGATVRARRGKWDVEASYYVDDMVMMHENTQQLAEIVSKVLVWLNELGWTVNLEKSKLEPSTKFVYLGMEIDTEEMTVRMTAKKNTEMKKELKQWIKWTKAAKEVKARDLARLIGRLSAMRGQHEEASLYLAKMNRLKTMIVKAGGWSARNVLTRDLLPELAWWLRTLRRNEPNDIRPFESAVTVWTDASESGWGAAYLRTEPMADEEQETMAETETEAETKMQTEMETEVEPMVAYGLWRKEERMENCMRELNAVILAMEEGFRRGIIVEGMDVRIRSDNTNVCYNVNRKRSGWRMRKRVKELLNWLKERRIRVWCKHIAGEKNRLADSLSRLSRSGDYTLKAEILERAEKELGVEAEVDLFARRANRKKERYCTLDEHDDKAEAIDAMDMDTWSGFVSLVHPPIPMLTAVLAKLNRSKATAIVICPNWNGCVWSPMLRKMMVTGKKVILGKSSEVLVMGARMKKTQAALPPGMLAAYLVQGSGE